MVNQEHEIQIRVQEELQRLISSDPKQAIILAARAIQQAQEEKDKAIGELMPKVRAYEIAMDTDRLIEMSAVAKVLAFRNMGRNNLFEYLKAKKVLRYNNEPYQDKVGAGYFKVVRETFKRNGYEGIYDKTMVTQKGVDYIGRLLTEDGYERYQR